MAAKFAFGTSLFTAGGGISERTGKGREDTDARGPLQPHDIVKPETERTKHASLSLFFKSKIIEEY